LNAHAHRQQRYEMKATAALLVVAGLSMTAKAAEPTTLTLTCEGTRVPSQLTGEPDPKPEPVSLGISLNLKARTVNGPYFGSRIMISEVTETTITLDGSNEDDLGRIEEHAIHGIINRVTGILEALEAMWTTKTPMRMFEYSLKCRPAQRMF
jgi:hypothetical protein